MNESRLTSSLDEDDGDDVKGDGTCCGGGVDAHQALVEIQSNSYFCSDFLKSALVCHNSSNF